MLVVVGLIFSALIYPLTMFARQEPALAMMLTLYVTLGIFLLLAARNPSENRCLIAFTRWSSLAHTDVIVPSLSKSDRTRRTGRIGGARYYRCCADRASSGETASRASFYGGSVGLVPFGMVT